MKILFTLTFVISIITAYGQNVMVGSISKIDCSWLNDYSLLKFSFGEGKNLTEYEMYMNEVVTLDEYPIFTTSHVWNEYEDMMTTVDFDSLEIQLLEDENVIIFYDSVELGDSYAFYLLDMLTITDSPSEIRTRKSTIGSWSLEDMLEAYQIIHSSDDILYDSFGTNAYLIQSCYFSTAMLFYDNFQEADTDTVGRQELAQLCVNEYITEQEYEDDYYDQYLSENIHYYEATFLEEYSETVSVKGYWNYDDKMLAIDAINEVLPDIEAGFGQYTDDFILCYLFKIESEYDNFYLADHDLDGMTKLAEDCTEQLISE